MSEDTKSRERVARNFIKTYGRSQFKRLLTALSNGESGQEIADEFNVSRERVRQWKNKFGQIVTTYRLHPEIDKLLKDQNNRFLELDVQKTEASEPKRKNG